MTLAEVRSGSRRARFWAAASFAAVVFTAFTSASGQTVTERGLIEALQRKDTRGTAADPALKALEGKSTRAFSAKERGEQAPRPSTDFMLYFDFNSAAITDPARSTLDTVGRALTSNELRGDSFLIAGHTDAKGKAKVNKVLSERRAQAVREYLIREFRIEPGRLSARGYGKEQLKNAAQPFAAENRRVQLVNTTK